MVDLKRFYISLVSTILLTWIGYLVIIPPWQNPDEPTHFEYMKILTNQNVFSRIQPDLPIQKEIIKSMDRHRYWEYVQVPQPKPLPNSFTETPFLRSDPTQMKYNPPFYYVLASRVLLPAREWDIEAQFYLARGLSVCLGLLTIFLSYLIAKELLQDNPVLIPIVPAFIGLLPQFNMLTSSVSAANLANMVTTWVIYLLILLLKKGPSYTKLALIASGVLLGLMIKPTTIITLPLTGMALFFLEWNNIKSKGTRAWGMVFFRVAKVLLPLSGGFLLLTWCFPVAAHTTFDTITEIVYYGILNFFKFLSKSSFSQVEGVSRLLFQSFWYTAGWMKYHLPHFWYQGLQIISMLSLAGVILFGTRIIRQKISIKRWQAQGMGILIFSCLLVIFGVFLHSKGFSYIVQGRHLFPALSGFAILGILGLYQLVPKKCYGFFSVVLILGILVFNAMVFRVYTVPTFYDFPFQVIPHQLAFKEVVGEISGDKKIGQTFMAETDKLSGIDLFMASYFRTNTHPVIFHLKEKPDSIRDLATISISARWVRDNAYHRFRFPAISGSRGKTYYFYLESPESKPGNAITLWSHSSDFYKKGSLLINGKKGNGDLNFKTAYESPLTFLQSITQNKPFPLNTPEFYIALLALYGLSVLFLISSLKILLIIRPHTIASPCREISSKTSTL